MVGFKALCSSWSLEGAVCHLWEVLHLEGPMGCQRKAAMGWLQREVLTGKRQKGRAEEDNVRIYS